MRQQWDQAAALPVGLRRWDGAAAKRARPIGAFGSALRALVQDDSATPVPGLSRI